MKVSMLLFLGIILLNCAHEKRKNTSHLCSNKDFEFVVNRDTVNQVEELVAVSKRLKKEQKFGAFSTSLGSNYSQCVCTDSTLLVSTKGLTVALTYYQLADGVWQAKDMELINMSPIIYRGAFKEGEEVTDNQIFLEPENKVRIVHGIKKSTRSHGFVSIVKSESKHDLIISGGQIQLSDYEGQ